jgi:hypothetical protein
MKSVARLLIAVALASFLPAGPAGATTTKIADGFVHYIYEDDYSPAVQYIQAGCPFKSWMNGELAAFLNVTSYRGKYLNIKVTGVDTAPPAYNVGIGAATTSGHVACGPLPSTDTKAGPLPGANAPYGWGLLTDNTLRIPNDAVFLEFRAGARELAPYLGLHFTVSLVTS